MLAQGLRIGNFGPYAVSVIGFRLRFTVFAKGFG